MIVHNLNMISIQDREALLTHFRALKQEMNLCRESERCSLTKLTLQSDAAIKQLERKREKVHIQQPYTVKTDVHNTCI